MPEYKCRECDRLFTLKHPPRGVAKRLKCPSCRRRITMVNKRTPTEREQDQKDLQECSRVLNKFFFGVRREMSKSLDR